jgi:acetyl esterase/lipase
VRDEGGPPLAGLLLCCPMLDDRMASVSANQFGDAILWTRASNEFGWRSLLGERAGMGDVTIYEAPGRATDLSGLPPAFVDVGSADLFRDEDVAFASTIWASGGSAELHVWPGGYHGFELLAPTAALSADAGEARRRWLTRTLAVVG